MQSQVKITPAEPQEARFNYFLGNDPQKWRTDIPSYGAVFYREAYPGIDLKFYGAGRQLEYDIIVRPGADPAQVKFRYGGIKSLNITREGDLALNLPDGGKLLQKKPIVYQDIGGQRVARSGKFKIRGDVAQCVYGFEVAAYDPQYPLVIDPVLVYSTYLGGEFDDFATGLAVDRQGNAYIAGNTTSASFPTKNAFDDSFTGIHDGWYPNAFVSKFSPGGQLIYSSYLGATITVAYGVAVDSQGQAYVTGATWDSQFPIKNAFQPVKTSMSVAFVTKFSAAGNELIYSTYLGGSSGDDGALAIAVDDNDQAYVAGSVMSTDFPTKNAFQALKKGDKDVFVTKFSSSGSELIYSTYLGGSGYEEPSPGRGIAIDDSGHAYVIGTTASLDFPMQNAFQAVNNGGQFGYDAFVTKLSPTGSSLVYSTYLGGSGNDFGMAITLDSNGYAYMAGETQSSDYPVVNAYQNLKKGDYDAFVAKFSPGGDSLVFSTFLGGSGVDAAHGIAVDELGQVWVAGSTTSPDFPMQHPIQDVNRASYYATMFLAKFNAAGNTLLWSTYLGGSIGDDAYNLALDHQGGIYLTGRTYSYDFPLKNAFQSTHSMYDAFVVRIKVVDSSLSPIYQLLIQD